MVPLGCCPIGPPLAAVLRRSAVRRAASTPASSRSTPFAAPQVDLARPLPCKKYTNATAKGCRCDPNLFDFIET